LNFEDKDIRELYKKNPVKGTKTIFSRLGRYRLKLAEEI